jgi:hypothetical protein
MILRVAISRGGIRTHIYLWPPGGIRTHIYPLRYLTCFEDKADTGGYKTKNPRTFSNSRISCIFIFSNTLPSSNFIRTTTWRRWWCNVHDFHIFYILQIYFFVFKYPNYFSMIFSIF